ITAGGVPGGGRFASIVASTSARRDFRYSSRFIDVRQLFVLALVLRLERLDARLPPGVGEDELDLLLHLFELLIAEARQTDPFLEELQRLVERELLRLEPLHDRLELLERLLEFVGFARHCRVLY